MSGPEAERQPHLVVFGPGNVEIRRGEHHRVALTGSAADRIATWHAHMLTHGETVAATYLAGVIDGLSASVAMRMDRAVADARAHREAGQALIERSRRVLAKGSSDAE